MNRHEKIFATVLSGGGDRYHKQIIATAPILYLPLTESGGLTAVNYGTLGTAANGTYSGVTLAQIAAPGGGMAPLFDGANDRINLYSAALAGGFNGALHSLVIWYYIAAATWADGDVRAMLSLGADANNRTTMFKTAAANSVTYFHLAGGTTEAATSTAYASVQWHMATVTLSKAADQFKGYIDGTSIGTSVTIGTWAGALADTFCNIGVYDNTQYWGKGYFSRAIVYDRVIDLTTIQALYNGGL